MKLKIMIPVRIENFQAYSEAISAYLKPKLLPDTELIFAGLTYGFSSVETELAGMMNGSQVVMEALNSQTDCDGIYVNCFDDPGVDALREMGTVPVMGPYLASMSTSLMLGDRIGILTTDQAGILNEERKARRLGISDRIVSIRAMDFEVEKIRTEREKLLQRLLDLCIKMVEEDRVSVICLGCTATYPIHQQLVQMLHARGIRVNVIEPISNGCIALESMVRQGCNNFTPGHVNFDSLRWAQTEGKHLEQED